MLLADRGPMGDVTGASTPNRGGAADYDRWFDEPWGRYAFGVEARALRRSAPDLTGARVLDGGCGTGRFATALTTTGAQVVGLDLDAGMLALATPRLAGLGVRGDLEHLPFPTGVFDVAMGVTVLEFVADPRAVVAELARVTRPGGRLLVGALNPRSPWGLAHRRMLATGLWRRARFLSRRQLVALGAPYGSATVRPSLYAPGWVPGLPWIGPLLEMAGHLAPGWGAFQVLAVDLALPCPLRRPLPVVEQRPAVRSGPRDDPIPLGRAAPGHREHPPGRTAVGGDRSTGECSNWSGSFSTRGGQPLPRLPPSGRQHRGRPAR